MDQQKDPRIDTVLQGRYRIEKLLGTGGMGRVYLGERVGLGRPVAVKFLHSTYAREPAAVKRFEREAKAMSRLAHPNCISVIDVGVDDTPYIVMEHVSGRSLCDVLDDGLLRLRRAIDITRQILAGLAHAHSHSIIHRDIKPGNIMLTDVEGEADHVSILDFGLAKFRDAVLMQDITASTMLVGTPGYMSPEQIEGEEAGVGSDLYAVGVMLFEMLTDHKPYEADHPIEVLRMHRESPIPSVRAAMPSRKIPRALEAVVNKALAKDKDDRYASAAEFSSALERVARVMDDKRLRRRKAFARASVAAAALAVVSLAVFVFATGDSSGHQTSAVTVADEQKLEPTSVLGDQPSPQTPEPQQLGTKPEPQQLETKPEPQIVVSPQKTPEPQQIQPPSSALPDEAPVTPVAPTHLNQTKESSRASNRPLRLKDVRRMIAGKRYGPAIRGLLKMRRRLPRNSYLPFLIAELCMKQQMWNSAITHYRIAIAKNQAYRHNRAVIRNAVHVLSSLRPRDRRNARNLLVYTIGGPALKHLRRTARYSRSRTLRLRAASIVRRIRSKRRGTRRRRRR